MEGKKNKISYKKHVSLCHKMTPTTEKRWSGQNRHEVRIGICLRIDSGALVLVKTDCFSPLRDVNV
uniref:Uncharacterized protein n=1 Tax=Medicago truncatula TaxID=3880 RepID=A2Q1Q4_MEDTR|nr:hypothetical protein MtrDRAFT_AC148995g34v2 [Medicago truncatula]